MVFSCKKNAANRDKRANSNNIPKSKKNPKDPNELSVPRPILIISMKYVSGEITASGAKETGINRGLMNIIGNLTKIVKIIVLAGISVGGTERINEKLENASAAMIIPKAIKRKFIWISKNKITPRIKGMVEKTQPKTSELHKFPTKIVFIEIGHVINLSRVICLVSHGNTTGPIEVEVRKSTMAIRPEII